MEKRRGGFMPEYLDHPVKDMNTWEEKCKWRMDPTTPERLEGLQQGIAEDDSFVHVMIAIGNPSPYEKALLC